MRRTTLALLLSLVLHLSLLAFLYDRSLEKHVSLEQTTPLSLHISTVITHNEMPKSEAIPEQPIAHEQTVPPLPNKPAPSKPISKKESASKPASLPLSQALVESNTSIPSVNTAPSSTIASETNSVPAPEAPSYLTLHKEEIIEALQRAKTYPELARKRSIQGVVEVRFTIKPTGEVEGVEAISSSKILSTSAIESVHKAKGYFPHPLENVTIKIPINYVLK